VELRGGVDVIIRDDWMSWDAPNKLASVALLWVTDPSEVRRCFKTLARKHARAAAEIVDFNTRLRIERAHEALFLDAGNRLTRSWVRDLRRLAEGLGMTPRLLAELRRTARIRSDYFDVTMDPLLVCWSEVLAALEQTTDAPVLAQGRLQIRRLIDDVDAAVRADEMIEPLMTELMRASPARIAGELIRAVVEAHKQSRGSKSS
jgi:hypothetical protein